MTTIDTTADRLLIRPEGWDKVWAPGTSVPGRFWAGTWRGRAVVIDVTGNDDARVVVEVADPAATVAAVRAALGPTSDSA